MTRLTDHPFILGGIFYDRNQHEHAEHEYLVDHGGNRSSCRCGGFLPGEGSIPEGRDPHQGGVSERGITKGS
jgi:hypothetical protein